jgi:diguanylate cyclase (GGDEF)-like protein
MKKEIEDLKQELARLKKLVYRDHLTGLLNRRGFEESINMAIDQYNSSKSNLTPRRGYIVNSLSLVIIDIDKFKNINDKYGHPVGDEVLKHLSAATSKGTRKNDLVGRWGGEEIVIGLIGSELEPAMKLAEKLQKDITNANFKPKYTFSAGVASLDKNISSFSKLYECADSALYKAKRLGRNRIELYSND